MTNPCDDFATLRRSWFSLACIGLLAACEGTPGESRIDVFAPEDASPVWNRTLSTENFGAYTSDPAGALRVQGYDNCWGASFLRDYDRETGAVLRDFPNETRAEFDSPPVTLDPPSSCPNFAAERVTLPNGERLDICGYPTPDEPLIVMTVDTDLERLRVPPVTGFVGAQVYGDTLIVISQSWAQVDAFSLEAGETRWNRTASEDYTYVTGGDAERIYIWEETSQETYALSLESGAVVWQENLGCEWLSLVEGMLVCGRMLRESSCEESD
jgi:outer membrane protein assembly factor BamB